VVQGCNDCHNDGHMTLEGLHIPEARGMSSNQGFGHNIRFDGNEGIRELVRCDQNQSA